MELRRYYDLAKKWAWLVILGALVAAGAALYAGRDAVPVYQASATLRISTPSMEFTNEYSAMLTSERLAQTYTRLLTKDHVLNGVIQNLGLGLGTQQLRAAVEIASVAETELIEISVQHADPVAAQAMANEIPKIFIEREQAVQSSRYTVLKASLSEQIDSTEKEIRRLQEAVVARQAAGAAEGELELTLLEGDLQQARTAFSALLQSYGQVQLAEAQSGNNVTVYVPAEVPWHPIGPYRMRNTLLAAVAGALTMAGVAFLLEYLDDTIKNSEDAEEMTRLRTLGSIGRIPGDTLEEKLITVDHPLSPTSEAYRVLRTNLEFSSLDKPLRTLLVTSPNPTEGKSTTVSNLATVMAQAGKRVIAVDADLRRPVLHRAFAVPNDDGLTNVLLDEGLNLDGRLRPVETGVENLYVLTSGPLPPNPSELLNSRRMLALIEQLKEKADIVIFDSPPSLTVADASVLATRTDGVLVVVEAGRTRKNLAREGVEALRQVGANLLGVVLNQLRAGRGGYYYYYYYGDGEARHRRRGLRRWFGFLSGRSRRRADHHPVPEAVSALGNLGPDTDLPGAREGRETGAG